MQEKEGITIYHYGWQQVELSLFSFEKFIC